MRAAGLLLSVAYAACGAGTAQAQAVAGPRHGEADVRFVTGMIAHHGQALEMVALVPGRATRDDVRMMAERIAVSQRDEIALMERWLTARGEPVPSADSAHAHHGPGHVMAGMLTPEEMQRLAAASGAEFDRLFLELMIRHHEGALAMVAELFGTPGGGQESAVYHIASEVEADQRMEIDRMRTMLAGPLNGSRPR
ncbi:DUF305 domain-containing protein [Longimicrobium sp.]|uniref:DUF305 domain-containing protein n=1 Tax=Longimicrobium sp. TaxID=2029185 RepID=UPI003B3BA883